MAKRTARQEIERAFHVSFKLPEQSAQLLDAYAAEVLAQARSRVAVLPTANYGRLIAATREQILNAITAAGGAR
ncbi:hypothetical protein [Kitasatospora sp. NPDC087315]|uniref:hypothetical protein n=1 Tax=Kitasatospora sp. NPDC087315 TaxID=3364069 RepID=UPI003817B73C